MGTGRRKYGSGSTSKCNHYWI